MTLSEKQIRNILAVIRENWKGVTNMNYDYCSGRLHTIQEGDTLYKISGMYQVPLALILRANPYVDIYNLQPGEKLCIPGGFDNETTPPKPQNPAISSRPQNPAGSQMPQSPTVSQRPQSPSVPKMPQSPAVSQRPQSPAGPQMPQNPSVPSVPEFRYMIRQPQSMQSILDKFGITAEELLNENTPENIILHEGTSLKIPDYAEPQAGDEEKAE